MANEQCLKAMSTRTACGSVSGVVCTTVPTTL